MADKAFSRETVLFLRRGGKCFKGKPPSIEAIVSKFNENKSLEIDGVSLELCEKRTAVDTHGNAGVILFALSNGDRFVLTTKEFLAILASTTKISSPKYHINDLMPPPQRRAASASVAAYA